MTRLPDGRDPGADAPGHRASEGPIPEPAPPIPPPSVPSAPIGRANPAAWQWPPEPYAETPSSTVVPSAAPGPLGSTPGSPPATPPATPPGPPPPPLGPPPGAWPPPTPGPGGAGWVPPGAARPASRRRWVIGCLVLLLVLVVAAAGCIALVWRGVGGAVEVVASSHGQIDSFNVYTGTSGTTIRFTAARGVDTSDGPRLACEIVRPTLAGTDLADASWIIVSRAGDFIASSGTPCP